MFKLHTRPRRATQAVALTLATFICVLSLPCSSAQMAAQFTVAVNFIPVAVQVPTPVTPVAPVAVVVPPSLPVSAYCIKDNLPTAHGAVVTVVCSTGVVIDIAPGKSGQPLTPMPAGANVQLQIALAFSMPVFITPNGVKRNVDCTVERAAADAVKAVCENTGNAYAQPRSLVLTSTTGDKLASSDICGYILPGVKRSFDMKSCVGKIAAGKAKLLVTQDHSQRIKIF